MIAGAVVAILGITSVLLFAFGVNLLYLTFRATRLRRQPEAPFVRHGEPLVCVQVPIYNERYVAERVLDAVCELDWPAERFEVQVLDDSDDETVSIVGRRVARWGHEGIRVTHVRRGTRAGYKAGALAYGMMLTEAPFIAIFDADFLHATSYGAPLGPSKIRRSEFIPGLVGHSTSALPARSRAYRRWQSTSTFSSSRPCVRPTATSRISPAPPGSSARASITSIGVAGAAEDAN